jgi:hypothetical protein
MPSALGRACLAISAVLSLLVTVAAEEGPAAAGEGTSAPAAPFVMPPSGEGDRLVGALGYDGPCALAFDSRNRPFMFDSREAATSGYLVTLRDGEWVRRPFAEAVKQACPAFASFVATPGRRHLHGLGSMTFDDADALYAVVFIRETGGRTSPVLIYSADVGETFTACRLPGDPAQAFLEVRAGMGDLPGPPAVGLLVFRKEHPAQWTNYYRLSVAVPVKEGDGLRWPEPVRVTEDCFGISNHSGGYSFAVTRGGRTHLVWAEIPPEGETGNPTFAATVDRRQGRVVARQRLAVAPPETPDVHSTPVIAADGKGYLHVVAGAHGQSFLYTRSREPGRVDAGWTPPVRVGRRQTYAALVCGPDDVLHLAFREWQSGRGALAYHRKAAMDEAWRTSQPLALPPEGQKGYGIFYHRLFIDRAGALYLSFTFNAQKGGTYPRALAVSEDAGHTWRLAGTATLRRRCR